MPVPEKLTVDWSQVADDLIGKTENALIGSAIKHANYFTDKDGIPLDFKGSAPLFTKPEPILEKIHVDKFKLVPKGDRVQILISGAIVL